METVSYAGRVAIITGAGRGLGREFATLLAARGASVVVNDIGVSADSNRYVGSPVDSDLIADPAQAVVEEILAAGGSAIANRSDVTDTKQVSNLVAEAMEEWGRIDIVINNAGIVLMAPFLELTPQVFSKCFEVHVLGSFNVSQAVWGHMLNQGYGRILNVCSTNGVVFGIPEMAAYDAAKSGLAGLTRNMAVEAAGTGINVNGLLPGGRTRGQVSTKVVKPPIDLRASLVAPGACWLVHEDCAESGAFFTCSSARMGTAFVGLGEGFQATPDDFTLEEVREHWASISSTTPSILPKVIADYQEFRTRSFNRVHNDRGSASGSIPNADGSRETDGQR
jgi:NAD(P)-dependent dehydrogenase (short-subunit alcohol dehydrogenase family)